MSASESAARMKRQAGLSTEGFVRLLEWLDRDPERAGEKYEMIRSRLIKIFTCRGCSVPEELADKTFDRVAEKVCQIAETYVGDPALYFYGVADKIYLEYRRKAGLHIPLPVDPAERHQSRDSAELKYTCLERCMEGLTPQNRELITVYYGHQSTGKDKIDSRKELAERLGLGANALWIRAHRIREVLKKCVTECLHAQQDTHSKRMDDWN